MTNLELNGKPVAIAAEALGFTRTVLETRYPMIFGKPYEVPVVQRISTWTDIEPDDPGLDSADHLKLWFKSRRHLLKIVQSNGYHGSLQLVAYFIDHHACSFNPENVTFHVDPELVAKNGGKPVADIVVGYRGENKEGPWDSVWGSNLVLTFASEEQANQYLVASGRGMPQKLRYRGEMYSLQSNGTYCDGSGLILAALVVLYLITPSDEGRAQLIEQHPDLADMVAPVQTDTTENQQDGTAAQADNPADLADGIVQDAQGAPDGIVGGDNNPGVDIGSTPTIDPGGGIDFSSNPL